MFGKMFWIINLQLEVLQFGQVLPGYYVELQSLFLIGHDETIFREKANVMLDLQPHEEPHSVCLYYHVVHWTLSTDIEDLVL